jgi:hypothetical protein
MPVKPTEFCFDEARQGRVLVRQGRLSRHKVTVGEPAVGSPPIKLNKSKKQVYSSLHTYSYHF